MHERQVTACPKRWNRFVPMCFVLSFFLFPDGRSRAKSSIPLSRLNQVNPDAKVLCSLRDVPTRAKSNVLQPTVTPVQRRDGDAMRFYSVPFGGIHHEYLAFNRRYYEEVVPVLNQYFDAVIGAWRFLNYRGWKIIFPGQMISVFPWFIRVLSLRNSRTSSRPDGAPNRYVLVSAGGGAEGLALVAPCIEAWKQLEQDDALNGREMVIFAGAFI